MAKQIKNKKDFASSLFLLASGLFLFFQSRRLSIWSRFGPEEGFFPLAIAVIIIGISLAILIQSFIPSRVRAKEKELAPKTKEKMDLYRVSSYGMLTLLYGVFLEGVGFLVTTAAFLFLILKFVEGKSWKVAAVSAFSAVTISYLLFKHWLGVPLPPGFMKGWNIF